jgi:hypothetical protein
MNEIKSGRAQNPQITLYKNESLLKVASSSNDLDPISKKINPVKIRPTTIAKFSNNFTASAEGVSPKTSATNIALKSALNKLRGSGKSCKNASTATIVKIVLIFILVYELIGLRNQI